MTAVPLTLKQRNGFHVYCFTQNVFSIGRVYCLYSVLGICAVSFLFQRLASHVLICKRARCVIRNANFEVCTDALPMAQHRPT